MTAKQNLKDTQMTPLGRFFVLFWFSFLLLWIKRRIFGGLSYLVLFLNQGREHIINTQILLILIKVHVAQLNV